MYKIMSLVLCLLLLNSCGWWNKLQVNSAGQVLAGSELVIKAQDTTLTFEPQEILAQPGQKIKLKVLNQLKAPLNFLLLHQGDDPVVVSQLALQTSDAERAWMPSEDYYIASTNVIAPQKSEKIELEMPKAEGVYYFVSTFPTSPAILRGKFIIQKNAPVTEDEEQGSQEFLAEDLTEL